MITRRSSNGGEYSLIIETLSLAASCNAKGIRIVGMDGEGEGEGEVMVVMNGQPLTAFKEVSLTVAGHDMPSHRGCHCVLSRRICILRIPLTRNTNYISDTGKQSYTEALMF